MTKQNLSKGTSRTKKITATSQSDYGGGVMQVEFAKQKTSPDGNWIWNGKEWVTRYPRFQGRWIKTRADWDWLQNNPAFLRLMEAGIK